MSHPTTLKSKIDVEASATCNTTAWDHAYASLRGHVIQVVEQGSRMQSQQGTQELGYQPKQLHYIRICMPCEFS
jgi:hypothetical protein